MLVAAAVFVLLCPAVSHAGPASPEAITLTQPDGSRFTAYVRGDEFQGWVETDTGHTIVRGKKSNAWFYAEQAEDGTLRSSGMQVRPGKGPPPEAPRRLKPPRDTAREKAFASKVIRKGPPGAGGRPVARPDGGASRGPAGGGGDTASGSVYLASSPSGYWYPYPVSGSRNVLIVLVNFADRTLVTTADDWYGSVFDNSSGVRSVSNFYSDNSFGALTVNPAAHTQPSSPPGVVTANVTLNHPDCGNFIIYSVETAWLNEALSDVSGFVNFSSFDTSGDGVFQNDELIVYFVLAGYEASGSTKGPNIWAHAWGGSGVTAGGIALERWALNGELNNSDVQHTMGVIAHELGHSMCGLPDLYDTTYTNKGMGAFSLMATGSWGRSSTDLYSGATPVSLDAWSRRHVGWSAPREASSGCDVDFPPALSAGDAPLMLNNTSVSATQFFLVENRYPTGWDLGLERWLGADWGGGLLIQHIDITVGNSSNDGSTGSNDINKYVSGGHQGVMIEEASTDFGSLVGDTSYGHVSHLFYEGNNADFSDDTVPDSKLYDGTPTGLALYGVSARAQTMIAHLGIPGSTITSPQDGAYLFTNTTTVRGAASDGCGVGLQLVEVSWDGGFNWNAATDTSGAGTWETWEYAWSLPIDGFYELAARATDNEGRVQSVPASVSVAVGPPDTTPPTGAVTVAGGDAVVPTPDVVLGLTASDNGLGVESMRISDDGSFDTEPWEDFKAYRTWTLSNVTGLATVEVMFRDWAGNESAPVSDGVSVDQAPAAPDVLWSRTDGSMGDDYTEFVSYDGSDTLYTAGSTFGNLDWSLNAGYRDFVVMRFNARGNRLWSRQVGTTDYDRAYAVAADSSGNAYAAGYSAGPLLGNTWNGWQDMVLLKYSREGELLWSRQLGTAGVDIAYAAAVGPAGNVYVAGTSDGDFDGHIGAGDYDYFLVKYDPDGNRVWSVLGGTMKYEEARSVCTDAAGNVYVSGYISELGGSYHAPAPSDVFIAKYDQAGNEKWTKVFDSLQSERGYGVDVDPLGFVYVCGLTDGELGPTGSLGGDDMVLIKLATDGEVVWTWQLGSPLDDCAIEVSADPSGGVYIAGYTYGDPGGANSGLSDLAVMKFDANGTRSWTWQDGFSQDDLLTGCVASGGDVYLGGYTYLTGSDGGNESVQFWTIKLGTLAAHCGNLAQDGDETGVDCGGSDCIPCDGDQPESQITYPNNNTYVAGPDITVTGTALDTGGSGLNHVEVSTDGGVTWQNASGTDPWSFSWTSVADGVYQLYTRGVDNAGNIGFAAGGVEVTVGPPDYNPPSGSVVIEGGEEYTIYETVSLNLQAVDDISGVTHMRISGDGVFDTEPWENYTSAWNWPLDGGRGVKTVYVVYRDFAGNESAPVSDDIVYSRSDYAIGVLWTRLEGTSSDETARDVAVDATGNAYVVGVTGGVLDGGAGYGGTDMFIAKYAPDGTRLWIRQFGGPWEDGATDVLLSDDGYVYVCGETQGQMDGKASNGSYDVFVVRYDQDGNRLWSDLVGSTFPDGAGGVATDGSGNVYLSGKAALSLDGIPALGGVGDYFVVKFAPDGTKLWTTIGGTTQLDEAYGLVADSAGNTYLTGYVDGSLDGYVSQGQSDFVIVKYDTDGNEVWARQLGSVSVDKGFDLAIGTDDDIYVSGTARDSFDGNAGVWIDDVIVLRYSPDGDKLWSVQVGSGWNDQGYAIAAAPGGGVLVAGCTDGQVGEEPNAGADDLHIMKFDADGRRLWVKQIGTVASDISYGASTDSFGNVYLAGVTSGDLEGETNSGLTDGFLMKLGIAQSLPELTHYNYDAYLSGGDCSYCHIQQQTFSGPDIAEDRSFCVSCHNPAGVAHETAPAPPGMHYGFGSVTSAGLRYPTYGNITAGEYDNRPYAGLGAGGSVACSTCHNVMRKTEDIGRVWELTTTSDNVTYYLQYGPWSDYAYLEPEVYRDSVLWSGPFYSAGRKQYRVDGSEYVYDETAGSVTFPVAQDPSDYVYVTLRYPSLRANNSANKLCTDCHVEQTHQSENCLTCHTPHGSGNLAGVRETLRTPDRTELPVRFESVTGVNSFADGDGVYDGVCEVCHTSTRYHTRDGSGFVNHSGGFDRSGSDCTLCHTHETGFAR